MNMHRFRYYLLAVPAVLTLAALTVPSELLQARPVSTTAAPKAVDVPCSAPALGSEQRVSVPRKTRRS